MASPLISYPVHFILLYWHYARCFLHPTTLKICYHNLLRLGTPSHSTLISSLVFPSFILCLILCCLYGPVSRISGLFFLATSLNRPFSVNRILVAYQCVSFLFGVLAIVTSIQWCRVRGRSVFVSWSPNINNVQYFCPFNHRQWAFSSHGRAYSNESEWCYLFCCSLTRTLSLLQEWTLEIGMGCDVLPGRLWRAKGSSQSTGEWWPGGCGVCVLVVGAFLGHRFVLNDGRWGQHAYVQCRLEINSLL